MIKNIKKFYKNNRIYCILMIISLFCFVLMGSAVVIYFINQTTSSKYGSRLNDKDKPDIEDSLKTFEKFFKDTKDVNDTTVRLQGKIVYVTVDVNKDLKNEEIQDIATKSLEKLSDEQKEYYDIQFIFKRESFSPYLGSKSSQNKIITWANYSFDTDDEKKSK